MAFSQATLHNHSGLSGPSFKIESTIFSNGPVDFPAGLTIDGSIVSLDEVKTGSSTIRGDVFANSVDERRHDHGERQEGRGGHAALVVGDRSTIASTLRGNKYAWFGGHSTAGAYGGGGTLGGTNTSYNIANGDHLRVHDLPGATDRSSTIPTSTWGSTIAPPQLDYKAMKAEADLNDPTYFTTISAAQNYIRNKIVTETINGKNRQDDSNRDDVGAGVPLHRGRLLDGPDRERGSNTGTVTPRTDSPWKAACTSAATSRSTDQATTRPSIPRLRIGIR
jgi:hypothetical protein